jgi:hypothetical protein
MPVRRRAGQHRNDRLAAGRARRLDPETHRARPGPPHDRTQLVVIVRDDRDVTVVIGAAGRQADPAEFGQ